MKKHSYRFLAIVLYELTKDADERELPEILENYRVWLGKHRLVSHVDAIIKAFEQYGEEQTGIRRVQITTAHAVSDQLLKKIAQGIAGDKLKVDHAVDASLIGGMKARIGDIVVDASVRGQLKKLYTHLSH